MHAHESAWGIVISVKRLWWFCRLFLVAGISTTGMSSEVHFDFEQGDAQGWEQVEGRFCKMLGDREFEFLQEIPYTKQGTYYLTTLERTDSEQPDDTQTGIIESPVFILTAPEASMRVGGGNHESTYVALCTLDGSEVLYARGQNSETLYPVYWDVEPWIGQRLFLRVVDRATGGWGHITFDDFRASGYIDHEATYERKMVRVREKIAYLHHPLREAIEYLTKSYGDVYPHGAMFLTQLDQLESELCETDENVLYDYDRFEKLKRQALLSNPLIRNHPVLFVVRHQYTYDHHNTHNFSPDAENEYNQGHFRPWSALKILDMKDGGEVHSLFEAPEGVIRDPRVHWDGEKIIFSMRRNAEDNYYIYEINSDGTGLNQLTFLPDVDNIHPLYLPDDSIVFSSTREPKYCMCNRHLMANLYRMEPDGSNIHQITKNTLFDRATDILPDGRILYDRWEYVDRNFGDAQALWTVNPDGTNQAVYWGNNTPAPGAVIDGRIIPGTQQAITIFSSCHDLSWGALAIIDRRLGMDGRAPVQKIWPESAMDLVRDPSEDFVPDDFVEVTPKYKDPHPLSDSFFLVSRLTVGSGHPGDENNRTGIFLVDIFGNELLLHEEYPGCFNPVPLTARIRPTIIPTRRDFENADGYLYVQDVYEGIYMRGVQRGSVKSLRIVESPEKRYWVPGQWNAQGQTHPGVNWHSFETKRVLGTVPVASDGSAYFSVPSDRFVYFQLLDENGMMIQSMRSGTVVQSGETTGCIGCHEDRRLAPSLDVTRQMPLALQSAPAPLEGWRGSYEPFGYMAEVQPVLDRHCVQCHDYGEAAGDKLNLAADRNLIFNTSYNELWRKQYINVIGGGPAKTQPAYSWGSHASLIMQVLLNQHATHETVDVSKEEIESVSAWIDLNAVFYPEYATSYPTNPGGRSPITSEQLNRLTELTGVNLGLQFAHSSNQGPLVSFDRPELSPVLQNLKHDTPAYLEALAIIQSGKEQLARKPDVGMDGFTLSGIDLWRENKYQQRRQIEMRFREAIRLGDSLFDWELASEIDVK